MNKADSGFGLLHKQTGIDLVDAGLDQAGADVVWGAEHGHLLRFELPGASEQAKGD